MGEIEGIAGAGTRRDRVERTLLSAAFDVVLGFGFGFGFDLAFAFFRRGEDQNQHQRQKRRTGVSALHMPAPQTLPVRVGCSETVSPKPSTL